MGAACCEKKTEDDNDILTGVKDSSRFNDKYKQFYDGEADEEIITKSKTDIELDNLIINSDLIVNEWKDTPLDKYTVRKMIGEGSYGKIYLVIHKETKTNRVMKKIRLNQFTNDKAIKNEIEIIKKMDFPHVIKIYEFFQKGDSCYIITEYCKEGELFKRIVDGENFDEAHVCSIMHQLLLTVYYCHINNIVHRDLKPENVVIESVDKNKHFHIKVIDFGTAKIFGTSKAYLKKQIGSGYYIAPEVIKKNYTEKCDLWSAGVIMYLLFTREPPFKDKTMEGLFDKICTANPGMDKFAFSGVSSEAKDLIVKLLDKNPTTRPSAIEALNHAWFKKFNKTEAISKERLSLFINNLKQYKNDYKLQQAAIAVIVHNIPSNEEIKELEKAFRTIDMNGDGKLTKEELVKGFVDVLGKTQDESHKMIDHVFKVIDADKNGYIQYEEFIRACISKETLLCDTYLNFAFKFFDRDNSGFITVSEVKEIFCSGNSNVNMKVIEKIISEVDVDNDGQVSFEEFKAMMNKILN